MMWTADYFPVTKIDGKTSRAVPLGEGDYPNRDKRKKILAMLSQRWMFENAKYKNLGENLYNKKKLAV